MRHDQKRPLVIALAFAAMLLLTAAVAVTLFVRQLMINESRLKKAVAPFENPEVIARYEKWIADSELPAPNPVETIEAFSKALEHGNAIKGTPDWEWYEDDLYDTPLDEWTPEDRARLTAILDSPPNLVEEIRRLAETGGPAIALDFSQGLDMEQPHLRPLRQLARILCADARLRAQQGDYREATLDIISTIKLGDVLENEPLLVSQLVRLAIVSIAYETAQTVLPTEGFPQDLARSLATCAARADYREAMTESLVAEGYMAIKALEDIREGRIAYRGQTERPLNKYYLIPSLRAFLAPDLTTYANITGRIIDASRYPYYKAKATLDHISEEVDDLSWIRSSSRIVLPAMIRAPLVPARNEAMLDLIQVGLAIEQYRDQNGTYPDTLDEIADRFDTIPVDPFTGKPYHYRTTDDGFLLYSVGHNLTDNNGRHDYRTGDIVWRGETER